MPPVEPTLAALSNPLLRYFMATRPVFLSVSLIAALIGIGTAYHSGTPLAVWPAIITVAFALVAHAGVNVLNILYINQFPDRRADEMAGKRHWVVRLGATRARWGYFVIAITGYVWLIGAVIAGHLPLLALLALPPAALSAKAGCVLLQFADRPPLLEPALKMTAAAACAHGLLLALALIAASGSGA